jgi:hypothetical protein
MVARTARRLNVIYTVNISQCSTICAALSYGAVNMERSSAVPLREEECSAAALAQWMKHNTEQSHI